MSPLRAALVSALDILGRMDARAALVGGLAVSVRTEPRFTRDVDLAVAVYGDAEAESLVHEFVEAGHGVLAAIEHEAAGRLAAVRLESTDGVVVDLLFASSGIEPEVVAAAEPLAAFPDVVVPVAQTGHLIALKLLSRADIRGQDEWDLAELLKVASDADLRLARDAAALIGERGYDRGRDLLADLDDRTAPSGS